MGRRVGVSDAELERGDATDVIWQYLAAKADRWLLVVDNADDPQVLAGAGRSVAEGRGWLRPVSGQAGRVLVTSRDGRAASWGSWCHRHRLGVSPEEAVAVLADHAGRHPDLGSEGDARGLAVRLGGLPLALKIAGAYLAHAAQPRPCSRAEAGQIRSYRQYQQALDSGDFDTVFPAAGQDMTQEQARELIGRTWDLTLDLLEVRQMPEARPLLRLLAVFADAPLPYQLLLHPASLAASPLFAGLTGPRLWQVITTLDDSGLLDLVASGDSPDTIPVARLHPLVRDTSRLSTPPADQLAFLELAAELVGGAAGQRGSPPTRQHGQPGNSSLRTPCTCWRRLILNQVLPMTRPLMPPTLLIGPPCTRRNRASTLKLKTNSATSWPPGFACKAPITRPHWSPGTRSPG